ncbi:hypothetical protein SAMN02982931_04056 [Bauldia litoralis]|uniref:Uncharacterized protein n=1 Tax=Bauldia litoralis TaxID=665467 RepID=A0A1G6E4V7_9HYPH|nr:hypothetical protein SAMN02982931_04056 [Bauldia litoralis]
MSLQNEARHRLLDPLPSRLRRSPGMTGQWFPTNSVTWLGRMARAPLDAPPRESGDPGGVGHGRARSADTGTQREDWIPAFAGTSGKGFTECPKGRRDLPRTTPAQWRAVPTTGSRGRTPAASRPSARLPSTVMAGLDPAIHAMTAQPTPFAAGRGIAMAWMPGSSPGMTSSRWSAACDHCRLTARRPPAALPGNASLTTPHRPVPPSRRFALYRRRAPSNPADMNRSRR